MNQMTSKYDQAKSNVWAEGEGIPLVKEDHKPTKKTIYLEREGLPPVKDQPKPKQVH